MLTYQLFCKIKIYNILIKALFKLYFIPRIEFPDFILVKAGLKN
jgi:hypothetical protein